MLKIINLVKYYGKTKGVENLYLQVNKGEIFGFIGPNGAGKSTTIKCIMNEIALNSGEIFVDGTLMTEKNYKRKQIIGYLPSEIHLYDDLTVKEMFLYSSKFYNKKSYENALSYAKRFDLELNKKIENLSLGNLKKVGIVLALMHEPKLLILDEPTSGLDPLMQEELFKVLKQEKAKGHTIFFSSHILSEVQKICDRVGIIKDGNLIKIEEVNNLMKQTFLNIYIESKDLLYIEKDLNVKIIDNKFKYSGDINKFLNIISKYKIKKLNIEEPSLEELFLHYYKEGIC